MFFAYLAFSARNRLPSESFFHKRPVTQSSVANLVVSLNTLLNKQSSCMLFTTLWRSGDVILMRQEILACKDRGKFGFKKLRAFLVANADFLFWKCFNNIEQRHHHLEYRQCFVLVNKLRSVRIPIDWNYIALCSSKYTLYQTTYIFPKMRKGFGLRNTALL